MIDAPPQNGNALLHGTAFSDLGITGQSEPDFFDWVLADDVGAKLVMRTARQVNRFRLHNIRVDILKALYESLIDPETRHDLGEYYTPDWLAARMVADAVDNPLERRVMDPACGSGTFLFHAVRAVLNAADASGLSPAKGGAGAWSGRSRGSTFTPWLLYSPASPICWRSCQRYARSIRVTWPCRFTSAMRCNGMWRSRDSKKNNSTCLPTTIPWRYSFQRSR